MPEKAKVVPAPTAARSIADISQYYKGYDSDCNLGSVRGCGIQEGTGMHALKLSTQAAGLG